MVVSAKKNLTNIYSVPLLFYDSRIMNCDWLWECFDEIIHIGSQSHCLGFSYNNNNDSIIEIAVCTSQKLIWLAQPALQRLSYGPQSN